MAGKSPRPGPSTENPDGSISAFLLQDSTHLGADEFAHAVLNHALIERTVQANVSAVYGATLYDTVEFADLYHEVWRRLFRWLRSTRASSFDPAKGSAVSWLGTIAYNHAIDVVNHYKPITWDLPDRPFVVPRAPTEAGLARASDVEDAYSHYDEMLASQPMVAWTWKALEAVKLLTEEQRKELLRRSPPQPYGFDRPVPASQAAMTAMVKTMYPFERACVRGALAYLQYREWLELNDALALGCLCEDNFTRKARAKLFTMLGVCRPKRVHVPRRHGLASTTTTGGTSSRRMLSRQSSPSR